MLDHSVCVSNIMVILAGETISTVINKAHYNHMALFLPANWVTSEITFLGCATVDGTFNQIVSSTDVSPVTIPSVAASKVIVFDTEFLESMIAVPFIKLVSTTPQATTDKTITIVLKK